ncbi:hypothetical protein [Bosea sp. (in: a-proteobacteria)]|uniref:hypothetical protein n=1 Tax=Bosea sp. (in: a-proteobacteria) TaxID=1871050 RepID=UPI002FC83C2C
MTRFRFLSAALALAAAPVASATEIGPGGATIAPDAGRCLLTWVEAAGRREVDVGLPSPCTLHKDASGKVRLHKRGRDLIALVEHSVPDPARGARCITQVRGVLFEKGAATLSPAISRVAACPPFRWDEKMFTGLF